MTIDSLSPVNSLEAFGNQPVSTVSKAAGVDFADLLTSGIQTLNNKVANSEAALTSYILTGEVSTHDLMITMEKARHSMQMAVEIRNRLVEAYQEITRMQV